MPWKFWFTVTQPPSDNGPLHQPSSCLGFPAWFTSPSCMHNSHLPSLKMNSSYCAKGIAENSWGFCTEPLRKPLAPHSSPVHPSGMLCSLLLFSNVMFSLLVFTFSNLTLVFPYGAARRDQTYWVPFIYLNTGAVEGGEQAAEIHPPQPKVAHPAGDMGMQTRRDEWDGASFVLGPSSSQGFTCGALAWRSAKTRLKGSTNMERTTSPRHRKATKGNLTVQLKTTHCTSVETPSRSANPVHLGAAQLHSQLCSTVLPGFCSGPTACVLLLEMDGATVLLPAGLSPVRQDGNGQWTKSFAEWSILGGM